ncbi:MAG: TIGR01212 family radical SAM protein [Eubacteriales bacterium]|nr:TIGR01212 family radical SAM protein [Eubacteriales bacterium]
MRPHYYSLNEYLQDTYGYKLYKIALNGGMSCPNRDGLIDTRGCIFCSAGGSGDFTPSPSLPISMQIWQAKKLISSKYSGKRYIAYFQAYTNTYADISYLRRIFMEAVTHEDIAILSIATRPDCLSQPVIELISELNQIKPVWIELGLQTIHEQTAVYIRRGYTLDVFNEAVTKLHKHGIKVIAHMIISLPGESRNMILETAQYIGHMHLFGVKLQLLHVLQGTDLAKDYINGLFSVMDMNEYIKCIGEILEILPPDITIHRLTGDGPKKLLIAPLWSANKKLVMNTMNRHFRDNMILQGRNYR